MKKLTVLMAVVFTIAMLGAPLPGDAQDRFFSGENYQIPYEDSLIPAFYVFGPDGDPLMGAGDGKMEIFFDVPRGEERDIMIEVFDPDTGGFFDWQVPYSKWDTTCKFEMFGKELLDSATFGESPEWDRSWYAFGPYSKEQGEKVGDSYRFRLVVTGLTGDDQNLFKLRITPRTVESFAKEIKFRLAPREGDLMYLFPEVPAGTKYIVVDNYDLDEDGGTMTLSTSLISRKYDIGVSESGQWKSTKVPISTETGGRMVVMITKGTQRYGNAAIRMSTDKGEAIPIYFRRGAPPVVRAAPAPERPAPEPRTDLQCNKFTFDATRSYDPARKELSFLWNFGDGNTSTKPVVTHIYEKAGEYNVTLTVTNQSGLECDTATTSQKVFVNTPPVAAFTSPELVCLGDRVSFDASRSRHETSKDLAYLWNLGDGTRAEGKNVEHIYTKGGQYNVTLVVDDNLGTACSRDTVMRTVRVNTPPVASAGRDINMCLRSFDEDYAVLLDGRRSRDPDGDELVYTWNMGDGTTLTGRQVSHVYRKGGEYNVTLTVDDGTGLGCGKATDTIKVSLNRSPVAAAGGDRQGCAGQAVSFDASASKSEPGQDLSYRWALGDGNTATGRQVRHVYEKGGRYNVVLTVDDGRGTVCSTATDTARVDINTRPIASLSPVADTCVGRRIDLDASGSRDPDRDTLTYLWDLGDGRIEQGTSRISHVYDKGGVYTATVTVDDGKGTACSTASESVRIRVNTPPVAKMKMGEACCVNMEQKFDASASYDADGDTLAYRWDFGDGTRAEGVRVTHTYTKAGTYRVVLTVDDGSGTACSASVATGEMRVSEHPVPVITIR